MKAGYRCLVVLMSTAMVLCTCAMACFGFELWHAGGMERILKSDGESFAWTDGMYSVEGRLLGGAIEEIHILRADRTSAE